MRIQSKNIELPKARESVGDQVVIGFSFAFDWLRDWHEFSGPITKKKDKKKQGNAE